MHDIIVFLSEGENILGVVIDHYTNPLDDYYIVYADYALHKIHNQKENAVVILENVIIPACDEAIAEYRLKKQHLEDMNSYHKEIETLMGMLSQK